MARRQALRQPLARRGSVPAPFGGWNTRDARDVMPPTDAATMVNWIPDTGDVRTRDGFSEHATGVGSGNVETLMSYEAVTGTDILAASPTNIYDVTAGGTATSLLGSMTSGRWSWANFSDQMGLVNGADAPQVYNGSTISAMTVSGSGLTVANLIGIQVFKNRTFFWESGSQDFWYSAIDTLGGTLTAFPLSRVSRLGGTLIAMEALSVTGSAGEEIDDLAVFIMSTGEVIIYAGTDPGTTATWALVGIYRIGRPVGGARCTARLDGDVVVITDQDYVSLTEAIKKSGRVRPSKLSGAAKDVTTLHSANTGWEVVYHSSEQIAFVNVPVTATQYDQHVMNLATGAACKFKGMNGRSWVTHNGSLYFGGTDGRVMQALNGLNDDGSDIVTEIQQSWSDLGYAADKEITATRPVLSAAGTLDFGLGFSMDYRAAEVPTVSTSAAGGTAWGSAWGSPWSPPTNVRDDWFTGGYYGQKIGPIIRSSSQGQTFKWFRTDYEFEPV